MAVRTLCEQTLSRKTWKDLLALLANVAWKQAERQISMLKGPMSAVRLAHTILQHCNTPQKPCKKYGVNVEHRVCGAIADHHWSLRDFWIWKIVHTQLFEANN
jgi:hypothetical protein